MGYAMAETSAGVARALFYIVRTSSHILSTSIHQPFLSYLSSVCLLLNLVFISFLLFMRAIMLPCTTFDTSHLFLIHALHSSLIHTSHLFLVYVSHLSIVHVSTSWPRAFPTGLSSWHVSRRAHSTMFRRPIFMYHIHGLMLTSLFPVLLMYQVELLALRWGDMSRWV